MNFFKAAGIVIGALVLILGITFLFGGTELLYMKTIGKEKQDVRREIFENTQSYVEGKRQEATKLYKEYLEAETPEDRKAIENVVALSFANFDEEKLPEKLRQFIYDCKYK